ARHHTEVGDLPLQVRLDANPAGVLPQDDERSRTPRRSTVSRCTAEQTPPVNRRWPTTRLPRPMDAATQAKVSTEGRRCKNASSRQSPKVIGATVSSSMPSRNGAYEPLGGAHIDGYACGR